MVNAFRPDHKNDPIWLVYPPIMMYSVLIAAAYILTMKWVTDRKAGAAAPAFDIPGTQKLYYPGKRA